MTKWILLYLFYCPISWAYIHAEREWGIQAGLELSLGYPLNRLGPTFKIFHHDGSFQQNLALNMQWMFRGLAARRGFEAKSSLGLVGAYGKKGSARSRLFVHELSNQTVYANSFGLALHRYFDQTQSSQWSGSLAAEVGHWQLITENDAFVLRGQDAYRTGGVLLHYTDQKDQYTLKTQLWTGNASEGIKRVHGASAMARFGHKDLTEAHFGQSSHGLLTLAYARALKEGQYVQAQLGVDHERVRHFVQNQVIHDLPLIPEAWMLHKNLHVPMLDVDGRPYLDKETQKLPAPRLVWQLEMNPSQFY